MADLEFPVGFLWGTATAAHQVEGANDNNDWWDWEQTAGHIRNGDRSIVACDWWSGGRYRDDFDLAKSLHHNAHRLSVEWSRIEPRQGEWSAEAVAFYRRVLTALRERGMTPLVTLHHFTNPRWLARMRGWETGSVVPLFARYATHVVQELGDLCDWWATINEPNAFAYQAYAQGKFPPGKKNISSAFQVMGQIVRAHASAYHAIKQQQPKSQIGLAHRVEAFSPARPKSRLDRLIAQLRDRIFNRLIFTSLEEGRLNFPLGVGSPIPEARGTQDFIGLNYYYSRPTIFDIKRASQLFGRDVLEPWAQEQQRVFSDMGNLDPRGIERLLSEFSVHRKPIFITENGMFDAGDQTQTRYLISHLAAVHRAITYAAPVKGYFWWTLVDNFEWAEGYAPRFGLFANDSKTQVRTARATAEIYSRIVRDDGIGADMLADTLTK
jgi:beta-glucosidase